MSASPPPPGKAIAVNRRVWQRRVGPCRAVVPRSGPAHGRRKGDCFHPGDRRKPVLQQLQSLFHRGPMHAGRQRETIVLQRLNCFQCVINQTLPFFRAKDPRLFLCDLGDLCHRAVQIGPGHPRQRPGQEPHLFSVPDGIRAKRVHGLFDSRFDQTRPNLGQDNRCLLPGFHRPDPHAGQPAQTRQHGQAHHDLPADRRGERHLKAGRGRLGHLIAVPLFRDFGKGDAFLAVGHAGPFVFLVFAPERPRPVKEAVQFFRHCKAVVGAIAFVGDPVGKPIPKRERVIRSCHLARKPRGIAKGEIEGHQNAATRLHLLPDEIGDPAFRLLPGSAIDRVKALPATDNTQPDRILGRAFGGAARSRPISDKNSLKNCHSPTSARIKSAMAAVSSRSKTGLSRSSGTSLATARMVGSPGAIKGFSAAARWASILGWVSRL